MATSPSIHEFLSLGDWATYGTDHASNAVSFVTIEECCQRVRQELTLAGFQRAALGRPAIPQSPLLTEVALH